MIVVAVYHLPDVIRVVVAAVVAAVADVLPVAVTVADAGNGCVVWHDSLSLDPDSCQRQCRIGGAAATGRDLPAPQSPSDSHAMFMVMGCATRSGSRHTAQDALRPRQRSAGQTGQRGRCTAPRAGQRYGK